MKLIHISDLHIGKIIYHYPLLEDQQYMLFEQILPLLDEKKADALLISGDIFDNGNPTIEAMTLYNRFLEEVRKRNIKILAISGNHDQRFKIEQYKTFLRAGGYYVCGYYGGTIDKVVLEDEYGEINFYLLPYIHPNFVKNLFDLEEGNYPFSSAIKAILEREDFDTSKRNVILSHQMVTGSTKDFSDCKAYGLKKEETDEVSLSLYDPFDYVALGHIHRTMRFHEGRVVYPGALLPYHVDETNNRYVSYVELNEKGNRKQELIPIYPMHPILKLEGTFSDLLTHAPIRDQFVAVTIEGEVNDPMYFKHLQDTFPLLLSVKRKNVELADVDDSADFSPQLSELEVIEQFYQKRMGKEMSQEERNIVVETMAQMGVK